MFSKPKNYKHPHGNIITVGSKPSVVCKCYYSPKAYKLPGGTSSLLVSNASVVQECCSSRLAYVFSEESMISVGVKRFGYANVFLQQPKTCELQMETSSLLTRNAARRLMSYPDGSIITVGVKH